MMDASSDDGAQQLTSLQKSNPDYRVRTPRPHEYLDVLSLLFDRFPQASRESLYRWVRNAYQQRPDIFKGLIMMGRHGRVHAATWAYRLPGSQLMLWRTNYSQSLEVSVRRYFLGEVNRYLAASDAAIAWMSIKPEDEKTRQDLEWLAFEKVTDLATMVSPLRRVEEVGLPCGVSLQAFDHQLHRDRLINVVNSAREGSLDCPVMDKLRDAKDVVEGHLYRDGCNSSDWCLVQQDGEDVGCLLLSHHADQPQAELVYFALLPQVRGHGMGRELIRFVQFKAKSKGADYLSLTCDIDNHPAWKTYCQTGFVEVDRWEFHAKGLRETS
ncbi:GNAT family N-acetyltransferase [Bremerella sp. JC770]|uniref:GNAT family N-acetyltransferase n=1 Tax=Bremerella sp. JC770 TaxID=3232137 RepID=UPI0034590010